MNNDTLTKCPACLETTDTLTFRSWTHYEHDSGWAFADGERVADHYCSDCIADIDRITQAETDLRNSEEMTEDDWKNLASRLAMGLSSHFSNWKDIGSITKREMRALTEHMGENWQRRW